ncbi:MAG: zinc-dependent peptidase [Nitrospira sp.]|nr:zinc-dependent peptidase [Nitrospira sp.]MDH5725843.1 zinc-dependent peptidase [Nitrospira sp.]
MLVTQEAQRRNRWQALVASLLTALAAALLGWLSPVLWLLLGLSPVAYWWVRRRCVRRMAVMQQPFPDEWEKILRERVTFFTALDHARKVRFRQLVQVFLDEVRITGIRTEVDDTIRMLVAASAVIPIFGFHDWEYHRLREVLIYPDAFDDAYRTRGGSDEQILGMVGLHHLSGVMILSKPALLAGFAPQPGTHNVGVHEFAHLVENEAGEYGLPPEVPWMAVRQWVRYVARELTHPSSRRTRISAYAYTNEHEFFAVLAEYFFTSPERLQRRDPALYALLRDLFHQDTGALLSLVPGRRLGIGRNAPCPCGSGRKYKHCCLARRPKGKG